MAYRQYEKDKKTLEKAASGAAKAESNLMKIVTPLATAGAFAGVAGLYGYFRGKQNQEEHKQDLAKSLSLTFTKDKSFSRNPDKFAKLFGELSVMSPSVAKNPELASKLISTRLKSGFDIDDVHKLSVIEGSGGAARKVPTPSAAAQNAAASALGFTVRTFGPQSLPNMISGARGLAAEFGESAEQKRQAAESGKIHQRFSEQHGEGAAKDAARGLAERLLLRGSSGQEKTGSEADPFELKVSEACLGQMLSDRMTLLKEAAPQGAFTRGANALADHLSFVAPALALGAGAGLIKLIHDKLNDSRVHAEADSNFSHLMRTNDIIKGNPEVARESYETLKMVAPILATRPGVLRSYLEGQASTGTMPNYEQVRALAESGQAIDRSKANKGFFSGMKDVFETTGLPIKEEKKRRR